MKKFKVFLGCVLLTGNRDGPSHDSSFTNEEGRGQQSSFSQAAPVRFRKRVESRASVRSLLQAFPPVRARSRATVSHALVDKRYQGKSAQVSKAHTVDHRGKNVRLKPEPHQRLHSSVMAECNTEAKHILKYLTVNTELQHMQSPFC